MQVKSKMPECLTSWNIATPTKNAIQHNALPYNTHKLGISATYDAYLSVGERFLKEEVANLPIALTHA
jgi:hypothetical protein